MNLLKPYKLLFLVLLVGVYLLAWEMQSSLLLKGDVSWQMKMSRLLLGGGSYVNDFFEINPPLSIYLYMPAVFIQKTLGMLGIKALRIYIFLLATFSLITCYWLSMGIFSDKNYRIRLLFIFTLFIVYLIIPVSEFGQRECLLLYLTMPYFLLVSLRLTNKTIPFLSAVGIGISAGVGFAIKPFFILVTVLVELYFLLNQTRSWKSLLRVLRPETCSIFGFFLFYLVFIYIFHPEYINTIVPIASRFYYQVFGHSWQEIIIDPIVFYIAFVPVFYLAFPTNQYKKLTNVLLITLGGFLLAYVVQQLPWYYHIFPALGMALVLYSLLFSLLLTQLNKNRNNLIFAGLLASIFFGYPSYQLGQLYRAKLGEARSVRALITELHLKEKGQPIYFISAKTPYMISVFEHAEVIHASRLQFCAWMQRYFHVASNKTLTSQQQIDELFFVNMLSEDIKRNKPDLIYVDRGFYSTKMAGIQQIDYIKILSRYPNFQLAWGSYHYLKTVEDKGYYNFDVYQRN